MSLEAKIETLTAAVERLTAVLQSASIASHDAAAATASLGTALDQAGTTARATRSKKGQQQAADGAASTGSPAVVSNDKPADEASTTTAQQTTAVVVNDGKTASKSLLPGDPEGTRYFHIAAHNTIAKIRPGEVIPSIDGMEEVSGAQYENWRMHYAPKIGGTTGNAAAATPAATTPSASTASSLTSDASATSPAIDGPALVEKCKALHARDGNEGLRKVLEKFSATKVGELITKTAQLADIAAFVDGLLSPPPAAAAAAPDLF